MKRTFVCTKENPLFKQIAEKEKRQISEIVICGYLGGEDLQLLSWMSQDGTLRILDMHDVTEMYTDDLEDDGTEFSTLFYGSKKLEEVMLPQVDSINYPMFGSCMNLKRVEFPNTIKRLGGDVMLANCPNVEVIYVPGDLRIQYDGRYQSDISFLRSGKRFVSDYDQWPDNMQNLPFNFFSYDGVLYQVTYDGISLYRYPARDERKDFVIPEGVTNIVENAFNGNPYLRSVTISESVDNFEEHPFVECINLETIIFKNKTYEMFSCKDAMFALSGYPLGMQELPRLRDIYLYAEKPDNLAFDLFEGLDNIGDVTLHVPCFCKQAYQDYELSYHGYKDGRCLDWKEKAYRKFYHIEEFDPVDFFEEKPE